MSTSTPPDITTVDFLTSTVVQEKVNQKGRLSKIQSLIIQYENVQASIKIMYHTDKQEGSETEFLFKNQ